VYFRESREGLQCELQTFEFPCMEGGGLVVKE
jgi:hypothetical protein